MNGSIPKTLSRLGPQQGTWEAEAQSQAGLWTSERRVPAAACALPSENQADVSPQGTAQPQGPGHRPGPEQALKQLHASLQKEKLHFPVSSRRKVGIRSP